VIARVILAKKDQAEAAGVAKRLLKILRVLLPHMQ